ncbi:hypothetical protein BHE74_00021857 [Ensete ventricosum]|nr:hypothetical protein BHE74_00021857 [Ensete ventricosum]
MVEVAGDLDYFSAHIRLREPDKSEDKAEGAQLPKSKVSVRKVVDSEECHNTAKVDLPIVKKEMQVVERGEEATMSPEGLSYPKAKCRSERWWTQRSATVPQRWIYQS